MSEENWELFTLRIPDTLKEVSKKVAEDDKSSVDSRSEAIRYALDRRFEGRDSWETTTNQADATDKLFREYGAETAPEIVEELDEIYVSISDDAVESSIELAEAVLNGESEAQEIAEEYLSQLKDEDLY